MCQAHHEELRSRLDGHGLTKFIARADTLLERMNGGVQTREHFEPLMLSHLLLLTKLVARMGESVVSMDGCALCVAIEQCPCTNSPCQFTEWIEGAAQEVFDHASRLGLMGVH